MENIPERLVQRLRWTQSTSPKVPSSGPIIVLLYAGKEDPTSLDSCLHANYPHLSSMVVAVDILRSGPKGDHDMLQPKLYGALCTAAKQGRVVFIGGGPNCRTWSILRHIPKPGAPTPLRGRTPETLWGLPHLDQAAQTQLDDDSILILRQMYITSLARASRAAVSLPGPRSFLEHPEDPVVSSSLPKAKECSFFWITEEGQLWMEENSLTAISFDQCRLGQLVKKATTLATDLPIQDWDQMRCTHQSHVGTNESSTLSRYPWAWPKPSLCHSQRRGTSGSPHNFRETLRNHLRGGRTPRKAIPPEENGDPAKEAVPPHHTRAQSPEARTPRSPACTGSSTLSSWNNEPRLPISHAPDGRRCGTTGEGGRGTSECLPAFRVPHLTDRVAIVQLGFRSRPLRDGGENLPQPFRRISPLATLGALIMTLTRPWIDKVRMSLASNTTTHPFQEADLEELRAILGPRHLHERCPGQPFLLDLVSHLASTLIGSSPREFGPLRRSLREKPGWGKIPPRQWLMITTQRLNSLPRKSNQPFTRNEPWTWWTGPSLAPRRQRGAAANRRNFARAPLQGLMSRTRSGRSTMGANAHIQAHTEEKTTAPMVGDCLHAIHWLRTAADHPHLLRAPSGTDEEPRDVHQRCRGALRGTPTAPACPQVPRALLGAGG